MKGQKMIPRFRGILMQILVVTFLWQPLYGQFASRLVDHSPAPGGAEKVLGPPDCANAVDFDNAGNTPGFVTVAFDGIIFDGPGDDVILHLVDFNAAGSIEESFTLLASQDGVDFIALGSANASDFDLPRGEPVDFAFDLGNAQLSQAGFLKLVNGNVNPSTNSEGADICGFEALLLGDPALTRSVMLATNSIWIRQGSDVFSGDVIVNQAGEGPFLASGMELTVGIGATAPAGFDMKADSIKLKSGSSLGGDVSYNELVSNGTILGEETTPLGLPVFEVLPPFQTGTPGDGEILVGRNETLVLEPGDYGDITVKLRGTILFTGGVYNIRSIDARDGTALLFEAASEVRVTDKISSGQNSTIGPALGSEVDASDIIFYVAGVNGSTGSLGATPKAAKIGLTSTVDANFYVPNGTLWLRQGTAAAGAFLARDVIAGIGTQIALASFLEQE